MERLLEPELNDTASQAHLPRRRIARASALATGVGVLLLVYRILQVGIRAVQNRQILYMPDLYETLGAVVGAARWHQYVGAWSRTGLYHPGPAWFYWSAPFVDIFGVHPSVLFLSALALVSLCIVIMVGLVGCNIGWPSGLLVVVVLAGCVHQLSVLGLAYPWNPTVTIMPVALGIVAAASVAATGSPRAAVVGVLAGAFIAQAHLGSMPLGVLIIASSLGGGLWHLRRGGFGRRKQLVGVVLVLCTLVPWAPVAYDQIWGSGNFGAVGEYVVTGKVVERFPANPPSATRYLSWSDSVAQYASLASLTEANTAAWGGADVPAGLGFHPKNVSVVVLLALVGVVAAGSLPRRWKRAAVPLPIPEWTVWLCRSALLAGGVQWVALMKVRTAFRPYFVAATMGVGIVLWMAAVLVIASLLAQATRRLPLRGQATLRYGTCVVALVIVTMIIHQDALNRFPGLRSPRSNETPTVDTLRNIADKGLTFRVDHLDTLASQMYLAAVLAMDGNPPRVEGRYVAHFSDYERDAKGGAVVRFLPAGEASSSCRDIGKYVDVSICIER